MTRRYSGPISEILAEMQARDEMWEHEREKLRAEIKAMHRRDADEGKPLSATDEDGDDPLLKQLQKHHGS